MSSHNIFHTRLFKIVILICIVSIAGSFFYYFIIFLPKHEQSKLDTQKSEQLRQEHAQQDETDYQREQEQKEYIAKRKNDCYEIYLNEKGEWNNVKDYDYRETRDVCIVRYESEEKARTVDECGEIIKDLNADSGDYFRDMMLNIHTDCLLNTFSKEF